MEGIIVVKFMVYLEWLSLLLRCVSDLLAWIVSEVTDPDKASPEVDEAHQYRLRSYPIYTVRQDVAYSRNYRTCTFRLLRSYVHNLHLDT